MYPIVLTIHSVVRWLIVALGVGAVAAALRGEGSAPARRRAGLAFSIALDVQLLVGLLLYLVFSPTTKAAMADMAAAMGNGGLRFWAVEHPVAMILAVAFAHLARPGRPAGVGSRRALFWYVLALAVILLATPWPFMPQGRPWIRM
jgi:hypothetical protein